MAYKIASPEDAAKYLSKYKLFGRDNWFNHHRFATASRFLPNKFKEPPITLFDFGCGDGLFLRWLTCHKYKLNMIGYDPYLAKSLGSSHFSLIRNIKDVQGMRFDFITALDVIEHIEDEMWALTTINKLLKPDGKLLLTIPAFQFLYSLHDAAVGHYRRYNKRSIQVSLQRAGFTILHCEYFLSFLIPAAIFIKYYLPLKKICGGAVEINELPSNIFGLLPLLAKIEHTMMVANMKIPCGNFMFVCAEKIK